MSIAKDSAPSPQAFESVAERIARDIQSGALAPGQWLKQIDLENRYQAKRMEVRRALDRLTQKRLVEHIPNRGFHVRAADDGRADAVRDVRLILEVAAADMIVRNATADDIGRARRLAERFDRLSRDGTVLELYDANLAFHSHLLGLCGNSELVSVAQDLRARLSSAPVGQWQRRSRIEQSNLEHFDMVGALEERDAERLKSVIRAHILQTGGR